MDQREYFQVFINVFSKENKNEYSHLVSNGDIICIGRYVGQLVELVRLKLIPMGVRYEVALQSSRFSYMLWS
jgi:hypothetical protein